MDHPYLPILIVFAVGILFSALFLTLSALIGPKKKTPGKMAPYECGIDPVGNAREPVDIKFSLTAMLFILFDIEAVFLFPWAVLYRKFIAEGAGLFMLLEMALFVLILALGLLFIWRKGALEWK